MAGRSDTYTLHFEEMDPEEGEVAQKYTTTLGEVEWRIWKDGEIVILEVNKAGMVLKFHRPEKPEKG